MASYRYLREIRPEDLQQEESQLLTPVEKVRNWWYYHWIWVAAVAALIGFAVYYGAVMWSRAAAPKPDYQIGVLAQNADVLREETRQAWQESLAGYADDRNGDGQVVVVIECFAFSLESESDGDLYMEYANTAGMIRAGSALQNGECCILLMDDPVGIQSYTGMLCHPDGTPAAQDETDWRQISKQLTDCTTLTEILFQAELTEEETELLKNLYAGAVKPMGEDESLSKAWRSFWCAMTE